MQSYVMLVCVIELHTLRVFGSQIQNAVAEGRQTCM